MAALQALHGSKASLVINLIITAAQVQQEQLADIFRRLDSRAQTLVNLPGAVSGTERSGGFKDGHGCLLSVYYLLIAGLQVLAHGGSDGGDIVHQRDESFGQE